MLTFTVPSGGTFEAADLATFIDHVVPAGVGVDLLWTGHGQGDAATALILMPRGDEHLFVPVTRIDGPELHIGAAEARAIANGTIADPFPRSPSRLEQLKDRLQRRLHGDESTQPWHISRGLTGAEPAQHLDKQLARTDNAAALRDALAHSRYHGDPLRGAAPHSLHKQL